VKSAQHKKLRLDLSGDLVSDSLALQARSIPRHRKQRSQKFRMHAIMHRKKSPLDPPRALQSDG
jgi:hypothetical protein